LKIGHYTRGVGVFDEILAQLEDQGVAAKKMFGHRCLTLNGKGFGVDYDDDFVVKLPESERTEALMLAGSKLFDPMGGRPMKEWVQITGEHAEDWPRFATAGMRYVQELSG
jgi:hypothetical protein